VPVTDHLTAEMSEFLSQGTRTAHVAYLATDGRPLVAPVWFVVEDGCPTFATGLTTAKGRALVRDPRVSLTVDAPEPPYAFLQVQGTAEIDRRPAEVLRIATACGGRYMGVERADEFGRRNADPDEVVVRVRPFRVIHNEDVTAPTVR